MSVHPDILAVLEGRSQWCVITADCLTVLPTIPAGSVGAVVTDPPYGMKWDGRGIKRGPNGTGTTSPSRHRGVTIIGDDQPFDPSPFIGFPAVVLWGSNHFATRLPVGTTLVWIKRYDTGFGSFLSDAELAWVKGGHGVYCQRDVTLQGESSDRLHPSQKPVPLMEWCLSFVPPDALILDPFTGSGTTGVAAIQTGRRFIGIEIDERYAAIARRRISDAAPLFVPPVQAPDKELFA